MSNESIASNAQIKGFELFEFVWQKYHKFSVYSLEFLSKSEVDLNAFRNDLILFNEYSICYTTIHNIKNLYIKFFKFLFSFIKKIFNLNYISIFLKAYSTKKLLKTLSYSPIQCIY